MIECHLCPRHCRMNPGERGNCLARMNLDGELKTLVYGNPCAVHVDPIEKKPLFHFLPGSKAFSLATAGCNLHCQYCQNWEISQRKPEEVESSDLPPQAVVDEAIRTGCQSIAFTYSDPVIFYEYAYDTSKLAKQNKVRSVFITAGYIEQQPLLDLFPYVDAIKVDFKGITDKFYQKMAEATLQPVLDSIKTIHKSKVWMELVNLIVPTWNDAEKDLDLLCSWVMNELGPDVPLHFSKFWPMHKLANLPPTPVETMTRAWDIAKNKGLHYVYIGNVPGHPGNNTYCPQCKNVIIERDGYQILRYNLKSGICGFCGEVIPGVWK
ncbi:MAG: AmmeMemoRadiSam system radical SAM enzyme [Candidatus Omnitrophica bacterium]|nr:AmmeMemoRadiSam system radical SAM enzyme [Candidatus Omnitrophota bacterium]